MAKDLTFLHLSDFHARVSEQDKLKARVHALLDDLTRQNYSPDLILFTGDVAYSGKAEEYDLAEAILFDPLLRQLRLKHTKLFLVPGNHDVDRSLVDAIEETGLKKTLKSTEAATDAFQKERYSTHRLSGFYDCLCSKYPNLKPPFSHRVATVHGFQVGIACLNSAWRCAGNRDEGNLFLTDTQVNGTASALANCVIRIALVHHPFTWYHKAEAEIIEDMKRRFEVVLTGHLHRPISIAEQTTTHNSVFLTTPALYEGAHGDGYNLYHVNIEDRTFRADFRRYVRGRAEFDRDTTHARDGTHKFDLPVRDIARMTQAVMVQRIAACKTKLQEAVKHQLQVIQKVENPVLVTPKITKVVWQNSGTKIRTPLPASLADIATNHAVVYGPSDSGKTIMLQSLASDLSDLRASTPTARLAVYIELGSKEVLESKTALSKFLDSESAAQFAEEALRHAVLLIDGLGERHLAVFEWLLELAAERDWVVVFSVGSELLFDALSKKAGLATAGFYELSHWGPSRIREFVTKYFEDTDIDIDAAYNFVSASLEDTDIPATPWVVALYLSIFPTLGKQVSSLSFVRLLEKIEEHRLGQIETSSTDSLYNKRQILMRLACVCLDRRTISVDRATLERMIEGFFNDILLKVDVQKFISSLHESGLVVVTTDTVRFSYFAFYDYFLARAFERSLIDPDTLLTSLAGCLSIGHALSLYGGIFRENSTIARTVLGHVGTAFKQNQEFTARDLDAYINDLLLEHDNKKTADEIADTDLRTRVDYEAQDEAYEKRKIRNLRERVAALTPREPSCQIEELGTSIVALKTFYNLFRNLENIPGDEKVKLLDQVLDFHINCNFRLIDFIHSLKDGGADQDFKSIVAYIVTMGSQVFLSSNIGNQSLQVTILQAMKTTSNDLKQLMLVCLYGDLRLPGYQQFMQDYVSNCNILVAVELIYLQTRFLLITHESLQLPASLISAFQAAFKRRHELYGAKTSRGVYARAYSAALEDAKQQHLSLFNAQEALLRAGMYQ